MSHKVNTDDRATHMPSWSLPCHLINKIQVVAEDLNIYPSTVLRIIVYEYFDGEPKTIDTTGMKKKTP